MEKRKEKALDKLESKEKKEADKRKQKALDKINGKAREESEKTQDDFEKPQKNEEQEERKAERKQTMKEGEEEETKQERSRDAENAKEKESSDTVYDEKPKSNFHEQEKDSSREKSNHQRNDEFQESSKNASTQNMEQQKQSQTEEATSSEVRKEQQKPQDMERVKEEVRRLYYDEGMTQGEVARQLRMNKATVSSMFKENEWKARPAGPVREEVDTEKVRHLYFDKGLSQREVAERLGLKGTSPVQRTFKEQGWKTRGRWGDGAVYDRRQFANEKERKSAIKERGKRRQQELKELREKLVGKECRICGVSKDEKKLAIHRKDFQGHEQNRFWKKATLESLDPDNYTALCVQCHRGVHWMHEKRSTSWSDVERHLEQKLRASTQTREPFVLERRGGKTVVSKQEIEELRKSIFGNDCHFCGEDYENRSLTIHRKDGKPHSHSLLWSKSGLESLDPNEWTALCRKCHRYVHWAEEKLGLSWDDLK